MWEYLQALFGDPRAAALISIFVGGFITWVAALIYYRKAGKELKAEAALLRKANMAVVYVLEHPDADIEVRRDKAGNPVGLMVAATARAEGRSTAQGVIADARSHNQQFNPTRLAPRGLT